MKKIIPIIFILLIIFSSLVLAIPCQVSAPKTYYGTVSYEDDLLSGNYEITAMIGSNSAGVGNVIEGNYQIDISPCSGITGTVFFYIHSIKTEEEGSYVGIDDWGKSENLELTINELPPLENPCGDEIKDLGEVCDKNDFGAFTCSNYGFNSGYLVCSDSCDYIYTDNCYNSDDDDPPSSGGSSGGGGGGSGGSSSSSSSSSTTTTTNNQEDKENETINLGENHEPTSSGITGGVIGFMKSANGIGLIVASLALIGGIVFLNFKKGKFGKKDSENSGEGKE